MNDPKPKWKWNQVVGIVLLLVVLLVTLVYILNSAKRRAESEQCSFWLRNNVGCVAVVWANDHDHRMPTNLVAADVRRRRRN